MKQSNRKIKRKVKLVKSALDKWLTPLGLRWWTIHILWSQKKKRNRANGQPIAGEMFVQWEYNEATLTVYERNLVHLTDEEIEPFVLHELLHILVNEMREKGIKHEERVVSTLSWAFRWVREVDHEQTTQG